MNNPLTHQRDTVLEKISQYFDFGEDAVVTDMGRWQHEEPGNHSFCYVYIEGDEGESIRLTLNVIFEDNKSAIVTEVYARTPRGDDIGNIQKEDYA